MSLQIAILFLVTLQRLGELMIARRNTARLMSQGAREAGSGHYPIIVALHSAWLMGLWLLAPNAPVSYALLTTYLVLQVLRIWTLASIGERWTTRIIILPGAPLVASGPYRYVRHPNYMIVAAEIACLPLVFGFWRYAAVFTVLNALVLWIRINAESRALHEGTASAPKYLQPNDAIDR